MKSGAYNGTRDTRGGRGVIHYVGYLGRNLVEDPTVNRKSDLHCWLVIALTMAVCLAGYHAYAADEDLPSTDKTLVAWVALRYLEHRGGTVLTLQRGEVFDGIVAGDEFDVIEAGEGEERKWMAGSDHYARTQEEQDYAEETTQKELIQMAIVYEADRISIYRNGEPLTTYRAENVDFLSGEDQVAVFGLRHLGGGYIEGAIEDARIYAKALSVAEIKSLKANRPSAIEPWAWWDFEGDEIKDRTGRFTHTRMVNATLENGRLMLYEFSVIAATRNEETMAWVVRTQPALISAEQYEPETPTMPEDVPENWLTYHLAHTGPDAAEPGDPNPAFYYNGKYHLHYIYRNKYGFCFAHVSSDDMVHWKWHPTVLAPPTTRHS